MKKDSSLFVGKHLLPFVLCFLSCLSSKGQVDSVAHKDWPELEITMGCGYGTLAQFNNNLSYEDEEWSSPTFHFQLLYNVSRHAGVGFLFEYAHSSLDLNEGCGYGYYNNKKDIKSTNWFTFGPTARVYWFNRASFAMYSRIGVGLLIADGHDSSVNWLPTFSPVSLEWGQGNLRICTELLSVGSLGLINGGIKYSF